MPKKDDLTTWFMGIMFAIMVTAVPWAMSVHGRLTSIETTLKFIYDAGRTADES